MVNLFSKQGVDPKRLAAIGFAEFRPIAPNTTVEGRSKNRRVVIVVLESADAERIFSAQPQLGAADAAPATPDATIAPPQPAPVERAPANANLIRID